YRLDLQAHRFVRDVHEALYAQDVLRFGSRGDLSGQFLGIGDGGKVDDETVEIVVVMVEFVVVMGLPIFDVILDGKPETDQNRRFDRAIRGGYDFYRARKMSRDAFLRSGKARRIEEVALGQHDHVRAGDL